MEKAAKDFLKLQRKKKDTTPGLEYGPSKDPNSLTLNSKSLFSRSFPTVSNKKIGKEASDKSVSPDPHIKQPKEVNQNDNNKDQHEDRPEKLPHDRKESSPTSLPSIGSSHPSPSFQTPSSVLPPNHQENSFNDCSSSFFDIYLSLQESLSSIFDKYNSRLQELLQEEQQLFFSIETDSTLTANNIEKVESQLSFFTNQVNEFQNALSCCLNPVSTEE